MFDPEFYPTSEAAWQAMNVDCYGKIVLDPSAGSGTLLEFCSQAGASECLGVEKHPDLRRLLSTKFQVIGDDWFKVAADQISHIDMIVMNPPFSDADKHILHAWQIAPEGCEIVSQCNAETIENTYSGRRKELKTLIRDYGDSLVYDDLYKDAARITGVRVAVIRLFKPVSVENPKFEGFHYDLDLDPEAVGGIVKYNQLLAFVNTYQAAIKAFKDFEEEGKKLNDLVRSVGYATHGGFVFKVSYSEGEVTTTERFAKEFQKHMWRKVFDYLGVEKYLTSGVMEDVNKFVESRQNYPFTLKNIYRMAEIIVGTSEHNMKRAIIEAVDNFTRYTHENRFALPGWKTNAGHMLNKKFIVYPVGDQYFNSRNMVYFRPERVYDKIMDLVKALCFLTGMDYSEYPRLHSLNPDNSNYFEAGTWYEWGFFRFKLFKKGTGHFEFLDEDVWARLNQAYAQAKGIVLPEKTWEKWKTSRKKKEAEPVL